MYSQGLPGRRRARGAAELPAPGETSSSTALRPPSHCQPLPGAGKTVMAAAVIETIFEGREDNLFEPDPNATILWFSEEPSLNEQSRKSLIRASEVLALRTQTIESDLAAERLNPGMVYFLNSDKLSKNGHLVRGAQDDDQEALLARPDTAQHNFWDELRNTADGGTVVYMFLDEAHRGMNPKNRNTIVRRLVDGAHGAPPLPILFGISATPERFEETTGTIADRDTISNVEVDPARVRDYGIIKDEIVLTFPTEVGDFETTVLPAGAEKLALSYAAWAEYTAGDEQLADVIPLMVAQVPDGAKPEDFQRWVSTIADTIDTAPEAFCNVLGEH
nr:DEAD/DEAH box helicase family protein [Corynebacterium aurimucosum]